MRYLGERGGKAEVNDAGRIRRLPFTGQGVPPEPGTRVNPQRDSCCCPKQVELTPNSENDTRRLDPRRTVNPNKQQKKHPFVCVPISWLSSSFDPFNSVHRNIYHEFGGRMPLGSLMGKDIKVYIQPSSNNFLFPLAQYYLEWDLKDNTFDIREFKKSDKIIYHWGEEWLGLDEQFNAHHDNSGFHSRDFTYEEYTRSVDFFVGNPDNGFGRYWGNIAEYYKLKFKKEKVNLSLLDIVNPRKDIIIKSFQPFRDLRPISDFSFDFGAGTIVRAYQRELDDPTSYFRMWVKDKYPANRIYYAKDAVAPLTSRYQLVMDDSVPPTSVNYYQTVKHIFFHLLPQKSKVTPEVFMRWYTKPESFTYERIH